MEYNNYEQPQCTVIEVETEAVMAASPNTSGMNTGNPFSGTEHAW